MHRKHGEELQSLSDFEGQILELKMILSSSQDICIRNPKAWSQWSVPGKRQCLSLTRMGNQFLMTEQRLEVKSKMKK